jgi:hypothetical protein
MSRVKSQVKSLHVFNNENKGYSWNSLILSAQLELRRIEDRAMQLREAIEIFRRREQEGAPCVGSGLSELNSATQNPSTTPPRIVRKIEFSGS